MREVVAAGNRRPLQKLDANSALLLPLPSSPVPDYTRFRYGVARWTTVNVDGRIFYSVPLG